MLVPAPGGHEKAGEATHTRCHSDTWRFWHKNRPLLLLKNPNVKDPRLVYLRDDPTGLTHEHILEALAKAHDRRILAAAQLEPQEARELMDATGIAPSTVYRRINALQEKDLLTTHDTKLRNGNRIERYQATAPFLEVHIAQGIIQIRWAQEGSGPLHSRQHWPPRETL